MKRTKQKREARQLLSIKNRQSRFITEYVRCKHAEIYQEAEAFYNHVKELNPNRRDLTKTHHFLVATTDFVDHNEFYNRKKKKDHEKNHPVTTINDNMVLRVQLLAPEAAKTSNESLVIPDDQIGATTTTTTSNESLVIPDDLIGATTTTTTSNESLVIPDDLIGATTTTTSNESLVIPDELYQYLLGN